MLPRYAARISDLVISEQGAGMGPGKQIAALREARGWSQAELARRSGVAQTTISRLEGAEGAGATSGVLVRLSEVFGVSPSRLLRVEGEETGEIPAPRY